MGESLPRHRQSRLGMRHPSGGGEIVEVQGGHIVRSTGRKDRHSKVCTAKGPRDRRVRLSAHTAIQFYDVQDRLGYDRPSKAVDWLITKARAAIDELAELPPWNPTSLNVESETTTATGPSHELGHPIGDNNNQFGDNSNNNDGGGNNSGFLPQSMDSDAIADTIKSFFPMEAASAENDSGGSDYPTQFHSQDLRLSLQSPFDNPIFSLHHHHHHPPPSAASHHAATNNNNSLLGFDHGSSSGWADFQRMVSYYSATGDYAPVAAPLVFGNQQHQFGSSSQRGPLQSSNTQSIRAWIDPPPPSMAYAGGGGGEQHQSFPMHHHAFQGFSGFRVPARIRGDEEEHDGISDKPSSASSDSLSRH